MKFIRNLIISIFSIGLATHTALADPAMVRISDEDTTVHVLGTFHILPPEAEWRTSAVDGALKAADAIYFEADVWSGGEHVMGALIQAHGLNPAGVSLSSTMSADDWDAVVAYAAGFGMPAEAIQPLRPWLAAVTFGVVAAMAEGYDPNNGVDVQLHTQASAEGRDLRFFESAEQQIRFLADLDQGTQIAMLLDMVRQGTSGEEVFAPMLAVWLAGDLEAMNEIGNIQMRDAAPELFEALIVSRNQNWAAELSELMESPGVYFVAVGTLHLPGEQGVIELMRARGFEVSLH